MSCHAPKARVELSSIRQRKAVVGMAWKDSECVHGQHGIRRVERRCACCAWGCLKSEARGVTGGYTHFAIVGQESGLRSRRHKALVQALRSDVIALTLAVAPAACGAGLIVREMS